MFKWLSRLLNKQERIETVYDKNDQDLDFVDTENAYPVLSHFVDVIGKCSHCNLTVVNGTQSNLALGAPIHKVCHTAVLREATNDDPEMMIMMLRELRNFRNQTGITPNVSVI